MAKNCLEMVEKRLLIIPHLFRLKIEGRYFRLWSLSLCLEQVSKKEKRHTTKQNRDIHQKHFHGNIETEQIIDDNEFDTLSVNFNCELESSNENVVATKRDTFQQPIIKIQKITPAEIEVYRGGKKLRVLLKKLKDIDIPQNFRKKCPTTASEKSRQSETQFTIKKRDKFKLKENVPKKWEMFQKRKGNCKRKGKFCL